MWGNRFKAIGWAFAGFTGHQVGDYCLGEGKRHLAQKLGVGDSIPLIEQQLSEPESGRSKEKNRRKP